MKRRDTFREDILQKKAILRKNVLDSLLSINLGRWALNRCLNMFKVCYCLSQAPLCVRKHVLNRNPKKLACRRSLHHERYTVIHSAVLPPSRSAGYCNPISRMEKITMNHIQWSCFPPNALNSHNQFERYLDCIKPPAGGIANMYHYL